MLGLKKHMIRRLTMLFLLANGLLITSAPTLHAAPALYKWVDENGQVRYSDHLPPERKKKRHQTLSGEGHILETREDAIPPEELARQREEKKRQEELARKRAEEDARQRAIKAHHDNVLLMTFSNEAEILEAQNERVAVIDSVINLLRNNIKKEQLTLEELEHRAKVTYIDKDQVIPGGLAQNIDYFSEKILNIQKQLGLKLDERDKVKQQYVEDLLRYRELTLQEQED